MPSVATGADAAGVNCSAGHDGERRRTLPLPDPVRIVPSPLSLHCHCSIHTSAKRPDVDTCANQAETDSRGDIAMTVATGFSVLFVVAIPAAIVAVSLAAIGCSLARDSYRRRKNLA